MCIRWASTAKVRPTSVASSTANAPRAVVPLGVPHNDETPKDDVEDSSSVLSCRFKFKVAL